MPYNQYIGNEFYNNSLAREFMKRYSNHIESELSNPLFKVETYIDRCDIKDQTLIRSHIRGHMVQLDDAIEGQLHEKGFVKLRPNEALGEWRKCPLCEIGSKEPHKCYDGMLLEPVQR